MEAIDMSMPRSKISQKMGDVVDMLSNATVPTQMIRPPLDTDIDIVHNEIINNEHPIRHYEPQTNWLCCTTYKDRSYFQNAMEHIHLTPMQKEIIQSRYLHILENFQKRTRNHSILFFIGHFIVTVGSLFVPALLSVQNSGSNYTFNITNFTVQIYWAAFIISLMVTISNGILTLFKVDKKYYFLNTTLERLRSEGWQYFGLTGRYSGHLIENRQPTHQNQFVYFVHYIEKIKMKQVEEEYYKTDEKTAQVPNGNHNTVQTGSPTDLYPRSPEQPLSSTQQIPEPVKYAVNSIIKSQKIIEPIAEQSNDVRNTVIDTKNDPLTANVLYKSPNLPLESSV